MSVFSGDGVTCVRGERTVFVDLGFSIEAGGAIVLRGPNGSGKSSLLRVMAGLLRPVGGTLRWNGEDVADDPEAHRERLHFVGHGDAVKPVLTAAENLAFWAGLRDAPLDTMAALARFGLDHLAETPGRFLSAGQRRRLTLARLAASPAELWLLDEPTVALDRESVEALEAAIADHLQGGGMLAVATHAPIELPNGHDLDLSRHAPAAGAAWAAA